MSGSSHEINVLFIGGTVRSGTTMLGDLLGKVPGLVHVGELANIWNHGFRNNYLCSCGAAFRDCPLWAPIVRAALGDPPAVDHEALHEAAMRWSKTRVLPLLMTAAGRARARAELAPHTEAMLRLYRAIHARTGARMIVDSSKRPLFAWLAAQEPGIQVRVLGVTRDPRAVAYSCGRPKYNPDKQANMKITGPVAASISWLTRNGLRTALWERADDSPAYCKVRYEDFATAPRRVMADVLAWLGEDPALADELIAADGSYVAAPGHSIAGNPSRFKKGVVKVKLDAEWYERASAWQKLLVTALTSPLLRHYGYPLRPEPPEVAPTSAAGGPAAP